MCIYAPIIHGFHYGKGCSRFILSETETETESLHPSQSYCIRVRVIASESESNPELESGTETETIKLAFAFKHWSHVHSFGSTYLCRLRHLDMLLKASRNEDCIQTHFVQ